MTNAAKLEEWAEQVAAASPHLDAEERRITVHIYHLLAQGEPVSTAQIADVTGLATERVEERLRSWPLVLWDDQDDVIGFWGLHVHHIEPTHAMKVDGTKVYGWCALDTLFITEILSRETLVESTDPYDGTTIRLTVTPDGVTNLHPEKAVVSLLLPEDGFTDDAIQRFCHRIHFFASKESAEKWMADRPGMFSIPVDQAFELGQLINRLRLGTAFNQLAPNQTAK
ncbi:MAG TPA: organomercurial lyase [Acidimicrobiia bacterium]|nr:organomercurial lyase [Acidimicrobiia bacterium]